jgi:hypothetical protein
MKRVFIITVVLLAMFQLALGQSKSKDESRNSKAEQELLHLENQLFEATKKHDVAFFQRILADDYIFTSSGATVADKPDTIKWFSTHVEPETTLEMNDLKVRVYGDTGVATGTSKASWVSDRVRTTDQDRFIDVFAKRKGKWYLAAGQTTRISREQQPIKK